MIRLTAELAVLVDRGLSGIDLKTFNRVHVHVIPIVNISCCISKLLNGSDSQVAGFSLQLSSFIPFFLL